MVSRQGRYQVWEKTSVSKQVKSKLFQCCDIGVFFSRTVVRARFKDKNKNKQRLDDQDRNQAKEQIKRASLPLLRSIEPMQGCLICGEVVGATSWSDSRMVQWQEQPRFPRQDKTRTRLIRRASSSQGANQIIYLFIYEDFSR
jgi:hypothetical protein